MSDPSTLLLITCAACNQAHVEEIDSPVDSLITISETSQPQELVANLPEISPPEAVIGRAYQGVLLAQNSQETNGDLSQPSASPTPPELSTSNLSSSSLNSSILRPGSTGEAVIKLQQNLKKLGYYNGTVDGIYGSLTASAVSRFQQEQSINVDGVAGSQTWSQLQNPESQSLDPIIDESTVEPIIGQGTPIPETANEENLAFRVLEPETISTDESFNLPILDFLRFQPSQILLIGWIVVYGTWWIILFRDANTYRLEAVGGTIASVGVRNKIAYSRAKTKRIKVSKKKFSRPQTNNVNNSTISTVENTNSTYQNNSKPSAVPQQVVNGNSSGVTNSVNHQQTQNSAKSLPPAAPKVITKREPKIINQTKLAKITESKSISYSPIATLDSQGEDGQIYNYTLLDDCQGNFRLEGNRLLVASQLLLNYNREHSYAVTLRRTDSQGDYVDKSFEIDVQLTKIQGAA